MKQKTQYEIIGELLLQAYPAGSVCSQNVARDIALQLPRVINHLRYLPDFKVEDYHTKYGIHLVSLVCTHTGTKQARDYKLSSMGFARLKEIIAKLQKQRGFLSTTNYKPGQLTQLWQQQEPVAYKKIVNGVERIFYRYPEESEQEGLGI